MVWKDILVVCSLSFYLLHMSFTEQNFKFHESYLKIFHWNHLGLDISFEGFQITVAIYLQVLGLYRWLVSCGLNFDSWFSRIGGSFLLNYWILSIKLLPCYLLSGCRIQSNIPCFMLDIGDWSSSLYFVSLANGISILLIFFPNE